MLKCDVVSSSVLLWQERKFPNRYSGDYFRDTLPPDLYELEQAVVDGDVFTVRKLLQAGKLATPSSRLAFIGAGCGTLAGWCKSKRSFGQQPHDCPDDLIHDGQLGPSTSRAFDKKFI